MNDPTLPKRKEIKSALDNLERMIEPRFFFLFSAFVFALDCGVNLHSNKNLYTINVGMNFALLDWGKFLVFLLTFSFLMAFVFILMRYVVEELIQPLIFKLSTWFSRPQSAESKRNSESGQSPYEAMKTALDRGDKLLYEVADR